jgi:methionyl-tRNA formyltransferase
MMMMVSVVFWGNSQSLFSGRHFQALLATPCRLAAVVDVPPTRQDSTNPLPEGVPDFVDTADQMGLPALAPADPGHPEFLARLRSLDPDLFLAAGYSQILEPPALAIPRLGAVNFHASLLPEYRGKHPVFWTLRDGRSWAGLTVHRMDPGIDTGDIIYRVKLRTRRDDTVASLYQRIMDRSVTLAGRLIADAERGTIPGHPQPAGAGSYFSSIKEEDFRIDWTWPAEKIRRHIAMSPGKCFVEIEGERLYFSQADIVKSAQNDRPGTILKLGRCRCTVATGEGALWIGRAREAGGEERPLVSFCRQMGLEEGDLLV